MQNILFDATRTKYPHTGLFHFCVQLGLALKNNLKRDVAQQLSFFVPPDSRTLYGNDASYQFLHIFHKIWMPFAQKFDLWHATYQNTKYMPSRGPEVVLTIHDLNFMVEKKSLEKQNNYLRQVQHNIDRASSVVAISNYVKKDIETHLDLKGKKVEVIYNGSNINPHILPQKPDNLPLNKPFFYTIGTIVPKKNFHVLPALLMENDFHLIISGIVLNESYKESIIQEAKKLKVADRLFFTGPVTESVKYWLMQNCALFCFPSIAEGFGLPVIEAMQLGKNVLISKETSLPEIGGPHAHYFGSFDVHEIGQLATKILHQVYLEPKIADLVGWASQFNWNVAAEHYQNTYKQLLTK